MKTAVIYGSGFTGHTRTIAEHIASRTGADVFDIKQVKDFPFHEYDKIVLGTNVHFGGPNKHIAEFANQHSDSIANKKPVLFICCSKKGEEGAAQAKKIATKFYIPTYICLPSSGELNRSGMPIGVEDVIAKIL